MIHFLWPCRQRFLLGGGERRPRGAEHPVRDRAAMIGNSGAADSERRLLPYLRTRLALMPRMASANSASSFSRRARSHAVTMPTSRPFSATGRRRSCSRAMSAAALCTLSPGRAVTTARDMTSETRVSAGSLSSARQRSTMSRSVSTPRSRPVLSVTGSAPRFHRRSSRAAAVTGSSCPTVMTFAVMIS